MAKSGKKKKVVYETTLSADVFDFMIQQLEAIQEQRRSGAVSAVTIAVEPHIKALQQLLADVRANK